MVSKSALGTAAAIAISAITMSTARAQIVNVQSALSTKAKPGFSAQLSGSVKWFTGNIDYLFTTASPLAKYKAGKHLILGFGNITFAKSSGDRIIFRSFEHLRYRYRLNKYLIPEAFVQHAFDQFIRLNIRALIGVGPSFDIVSKKRLDIVGGVSYMFEYEKLSTETGVSDSGKVNKDHRASSYLMATVGLDKRLSLTQTVYFQPLFKDPSDFRMYSDTGLSIALNKYLTFTNSLVVLYDRNPPDTVEKLDTRLIASLTLSIL